MSRAASILLFMRCCVTAADMVSACEMGSIGVADLDEVLERVLEAREALLDGDETTCDRILGELEDELLRRTR